LKILISKLPDNPWWGHGTPMYVNNPAMRKGQAPNQKLVEIESYMLSQLFKKLPFETVEVDFPYILDQHNFDLRKHDFVFVRDLFISNQRGEVVISKFREKDRQIEADIMQVYLSALGLKTYRLPDKSSCYSEGGEFYFCPGDNLLFGGISRNNITGTEKTAELLNVGELVIIETDAFHLDTVFTPVLDKEKKLVAMIGCLELLTSDSVKRLKKLADKKNIILLDVSVVDGIGTQSELGEFAVNCLPMPGYLIGPTRFHTKKVDELLKSLDIMHITIPLTQYRLSGGAVHCLTNEI